MTTIPADLKLRYALHWKMDAGKLVPGEYANVIFAEPRETFSEDIWTPEGLKPQEYVKVLNRDINRGRIRYPFESEFEEVKA